MAVEFQVMLGANNEATRTIQPTVSHEPKSAFAGLGQWFARGGFDRNGREIVAQASTEAAAVRRWHWLATNEA